MWLIYACKWSQGREDPRPNWGISPTRLDVGMWVVSRSQTARFRVRTLKGTLHVYRMWADVKPRLGQSCRYRQTYRAAGDTRDDPSPDPSVAVAVSERSTLAPKPRSRCHEACGNFPSTAIAQARHRHQRRVAPLLRTTMSTCCPSFWVSRPR